MLNARSRLGGSLPPGTFALLAEAPRLHVAPTESGREYAEDRYDNGDHNDLCRHRTNSVWFIDASIAESRACSFDLDQETRSVERKQRCYLYAARSSNLGGRHPLGDVQWTSRSAPKTWPFAT